jgi:Cu(I)/Ag(I) efflux system membrane protein CusA/SilA
VGGRKFEIGDMGYVVRGLGYIRNIEDIRSMPVGKEGTTPIRMMDIATVQMGGDLRLGIFDHNGEGEVVGGIVVMRYKENADVVIKRVKAKLADIAKGLPEGVKFKTAYDRSELIEAAIASVKRSIVEEMVVVSLIVLLFLFHLRSAFIIIIQIPLSIAISFILLQMFGISSNIMSITGIALAIGVIVDDGIVMVENAYRHLADASNLNRQFLGDGGQ